MKKLIIIIAVLFISSALGLNAEAQTNEVKSFVNEIDSEALKSTKITPVLDTPIRTNENLIYCSTFQIAWNELCNKHAMGTLEIEKAPNYVKKLNELYKQQPLLSEDSYLAMAGTGAENIVDKINEAVGKKFGHLNKDELPPKLNFNLLPKDIVAFAYLYKNLEFEKPFNITKPIYMKCQNKIFKAAAYGYDLNDVHDEEFGKQFEVLYHKPKLKNDYTSIEVVLKLISKNTTEEIIISTLPAGKTIKDTYDCINKAINSYKKERYIISLLQIPKMNFNILHSYNELAGKKILNKPIKNYLIRKAIQKFAFILNENGSKIAVYAFWEYYGIVNIRTVPITIECPFVIYLKDKTQSIPYFMAYVATPELLVRSEDDKKSMLDDEIELNPILKEFCRYLIIDFRDLREYLKFINAKVEDGSNTLLLALKKKVYIQSQIQLNYKKEHRGEKSKIEENSLKVKQDYYFKLIEHLIKKGVEVNSCNNSCMTPLMQAVENGDFEIVELLLKSGADISAKRKDGKDALTIAKTNKNDKIIKLLLDKKK